MSYYYNNKLLLNAAFDKLLKNIEDVYWDHEMDKYCIEDNNKTENKNNNESNLTKMIAMGWVLVLLMFLLKSII